MLTGGGMTSCEAMNHKEDGTCGTVTIGETVHATGISQSPYTYPEP